jgi:hypothetical protein
MPLIDGTIQNSKSFGIASFLASFLDSFLATFLPIDHLYLFSSPIHPDRSPPAAVVFMDRSP